jgi:ABC-type sugar transport system ATPase subunit
MSIDLRNVSKAFKTIPSSMACRFRWPRAKRWSCSARPAPARPCCSADRGGDRTRTGQIELNGRDMAGCRAEDRGIGMAFQNFALFPHMDAFANIAAPLTRAVGQSKPVKETVEKVARCSRSTMCCTTSRRSCRTARSSAPRLPAPLSAAPSILLLDDPLRNVDAKLRFEMRLELPRLLKDQNATVIYVTQDYKEAMALGHRIAVMNAHGLQQIGTPEDIYLTPGNTEIARLFGDPVINKGVDKFYGPIDGGRPRRQSISMEVQKGEIVALLGSSGCGKTSTLRMVAGFEAVGAGRSPSRWPARSADPAPGQAQCGHGLRGLFAVPAAHSAREHRLRPQGVASAPIAQVATPRCRRWPRCWRSTGHPRPLPELDLGRPAAARQPRPRAGAQRRSAPSRRTDGPARAAVAHAPARADQALHQGARPDRHPRHPRPDRGQRHGRPHRGDGGRRAPAVRQPRNAQARARPTCSPAPSSASRR